MAAIPMAASVSATPSLWRLISPSRIFELEIVGRVLDQSLVLFPFLQQEGAEDKVVEIGAHKALVGIGGLHTFTRKA